VLYHDPEGYFSITFTLVFSANDASAAQSVDGIFASFDLTESGVSPPHAMSFQRQWCGV
jgi:hypothetical protein